MRIFSRLIPKVPGKLRDSLRRRITNDKQLGIHKTGAGVEQTEAAIIGFDLESEIGEGIVTPDSRRLGGEHRSAKRVSYDEEVELLRTGIENERHQRAFNRKFLWLVAIPVLALVYWKLS